LELEDPILSRCSNQPGFIVDSSIQVHIP
jgi:hypothetical protein